MAPIAGLIDVRPNYFDLKKSAGWPWRLTR